MPEMEILKTFIRCTFCFICCCLPFGFIVIGSMAIAGNDDLFGSILIGAGGLIWVSGILCACISLCLARHKEEPILPYTYIPPKPPVYPKPKPPAPVYPKPTPPVYPKPKPPAPVYHPDTVAISQVSAGVQFEANHINAWLVIDASGSMYGKAWNTVLAGVAKVIQDLCDSDLVGIVTFNDKVSMVDVNFKQNLNLHPLLRTKPEGCTKLYDAIIEAGTAACGSHLAMQEKLDNVNVISYMIVLTDGEDTDSIGSLEECKKILQMFNQFRNFKVILAGVRLTPEAAAIMREMSHIGDADIEFRELHSNADISSLFEHVSVNLVARVRTLVVSS